MAEPIYEDLVHDWEGYKLIKGSLKNAKKIRLNVLIKDAKVPMVGITVGQEKFCHDLQGVE